MSMPLAEHIAAATAAAGAARRTLPVALRVTCIQAAVVSLLLVPSIVVYLAADRLLPVEMAAGRALVVAALLVLAAFVFPEVRRGVYERLDRALFPEGQGRRRLLTGLIHEIATMLDVRALAYALGGRLREVIDVEDVGLWLRDDGGGRYRQIGGMAARVGAREVAGDDAVALDAWIAGDDAPPRFVAGAAESDRVAHALARMGGHLGFPLASKSGPLGVLVIGRPRAGTHALHEHLELLAVLADQVAVVAENARLYEELMASNLKLSESRQMLQRASRLTTVGTLAAGLAHEIRNPLAAVQTFLQILPDRTDDPEIMTDFRNVALGEVQRVSKLVTEMLTMARPPAAHFERTALEDVVEQVVRLVRVQAERQRVELRRTGDALPEGYADAPRLKQALLNVVLNAIEASTPGTEVVVGTRTLDDDGRRLVEVAVSDHGPGVPPERRELIFQPFATTKDGGTGLGLAVTRQIVTDHGGRIRVESAEGTGATFVLQVPVEHRVAC